MKKRILLIDDSKTQLNTLKLLLAKAGHEVYTANDGLEGYQIASCIKPDLIVSDIIMPNINGYQLCRLLKGEEATKNIPVILLTILNKKLDKFWGMRAGADAYLNKDLGFDALVAQINAIAEKTPSLPSPDEDDIQQCIIENSGIQQKIHDILDQALIESTIANEFRNLSEFITKEKVITEGIFSIISSIIDFNAAGVFFNNRDDKKIKNLNIVFSDIVFTESLPKEIEQDFFTNFFSGMDIKNGELLISNKLFEDINLNSEVKPVKIKTIDCLKSKIIVPIVYDNQVLGGIALYHTDENKFNPSTKLFNIILNELKLLMRVKWLYSETQFLAITDELTTLYNRRFFQQTIEREFSRAKRYGNPLSLAIIDIDHFKNVNDSYGHQLGDKVLEEISKLIKNYLRKTDYVARYGGEEIAAIFPETELNAAVIPLERLQKSIKELKFFHEGKHISVTVSIGVSSVNEETKDSKELIENADKALYRAKNAGRDKIEVFKVEQKAANRK
ncbi:MAG: diguanylate cyclase [Candidatus Gastranaerophilales bacterium]|nr:diguanylate cyclase [Candidatus Gastranaerophilales bacterium]